MSNTFFEKSREIANDFLQSIVFLDDRAYSKSDNPNQNSINDLDAIEITKLFSKSKKICAIYDPETLEDLANFEEISKKSDVIILDWFIDISETVNNSVDLESDAEDDDIRGKHTKKIISNLISQDNKESLKLILIYTGETDLIEILNQIGSLNENSIINEDAFTVYIGKFKILVRAKDNNTDGEDTRFKHMPKSQEMILSYEKLPKFILDEFTQMTNGLLSNFALLSLTILRENSSKILGLFSNNMDSAYIGHKAIIPKQEDAEDLLIELFGDCVKDLLYYTQINDQLRNDLIEPWIENIINEEDFTFSNNIFSKNHDVLKQFLNSNDEIVKNRFNTILQHINPQLKNHLLENPTKIFTNNSDIESVSDRDKGFSKLTHHKSLFIPKSTVPKLTIGTVIKSSHIQNSYYICIQQKCDSVRIPKGVERKFLFIPLIVSESKFDIITPDGIKLKRIKDSFSIRTIKFVCKDDKGVIRAEQEADGSFIFKQKYEDEHFEWVLELKDLHSQRIIIEYTSQLSRVGLDESEWHRRLSN